MADKPQPAIDTDAIEFALESIELTIQGMIAKMISPGDIAARLHYETAAIKAKLPHRMQQQVLTTNLTQPSEAADLAAKMGAKQ